MRDAGVPHGPQGGCTSLGERRAAIEKTADAVTEAVRERLKAGAAARKEIPPKAAIAQGESKLADQFDPEYGGFGYDPNNPRRPKFPEPVNLVFLLDQHRRGGPSAGGITTIKMVTKTLEEMARGGIRDHLGGGYHRYATDRYWIMPHFEKMLYDNAQLASVHLAAYEITRDLGGAWRLKRRSSSSRAR